MVRATERVLWSWGLVGFEPPWLVKGHLGVTGELWEAWTSLIRSLHMLACPQGEAERQD